MPTKKVAIIGSGFAGVWAAGVLSRFKEIAEVTVIDKSGVFNFLPALPDIIGRGVSPDHLIHPIPQVARLLGFTFLQEEVRNLDLEKNTITTDRTTIKYDYALVASGSETNFYGNNELRQAAFKIDDASDAWRLRETLRQEDFDYYLVAGAGYTGIEVATNMRRYLQKRNLSKPIIMIEKGPSLLGPLPDWMKQYIAANLRQLDIEVRLNSGIAVMRDRAVTLADKTTFANALLVWAAGVRTAGFIQTLPLEKTPQGRIKVDVYLRARPDCFFAGDNACVMAGDTMLRMAVQFAILQGRTAAGNIVRSIQGKKLAAYKPVDLGYVIPLANDRACGRIMGIDMKGRLPIALHYLMCAYRSYGWKNKTGLLRDVLRKTH